jgi:hypothetical protein
MNEYSIKFIDKLTLLEILLNEVALIQLLFELINSSGVKLHNLIEFLDSLLRTFQCGLGSVQVTNNRSLVSITELFSRRGHILDWSFYLGHLDILMFRVTPRKAHLKCHWLPDISGD